MCPVPAQAKISEQGLPEEEGEVFIRHKEQSSAVDPALSKGGDIDCDDKVEHEKQRRVKGDGPADNKAISRRYHEVSLRGAIDDAAVIGWIDGWALPPSPLPLLLT